MQNKELFQLALNINNPCFIKEIDFNEKDKKLNIHIDFAKGSTFSYEYIETKIETIKDIVDGKETNIDKEIEVNKETFNNLKAYDTINKKWQHLNFFEHTCYIHARVPRVKLPWKN